MKKNLIIWSISAMILSGLVVMSETNSPEFKVQMSTSDTTINSNKVNKTEEIKIYNKDNTNFEILDKEFFKENMKNAPQGKNHRDFSQGGKEKAFPDNQKGVRPDKMEKPQDFRDNGGKNPDKRPKYKPDSQPGGKLMPKEWDN